MESGQPDVLCRAANATVKSFMMTIQATLEQATLDPVRDAARTGHLGATRHASPGVWLRVVMDLLRPWREQKRARRQQRVLSELDDHMLKDIGLTRSAVGCRQRSDSGGAGLEWPPRRGAK